MSSSFHRIQFAITRSGTGFDNVDLVSGGTFHAHSEVDDTAVGDFESDCGFRQFKCTYERSHCVANARLLCDDVIF